MSRLKKLLCVLLAMAMLIPGSILVHAAENSGDDSIPVSTDATGASMEESSEPTQDTKPQEAVTPIQETTAPTQAPTEPATEAPTDPVEETTAPTEPAPTEPPVTQPERFVPHGHDDVPLFFQNDYPEQRFGAGTVATSGCSITCVAMVASHLTGHVYLPNVLADYFGGKAQNNMARLEYACNALDLPWYKARDFVHATEALREGKIAIFLMNQKSIFTNTQHFIVVTSINENGRYMVNDPNRPNYDSWRLKDGFVDGFTREDMINGYSGAWIFDPDSMPENPEYYYEVPWTEPSRYPSTLKLTEEEKDLLAKLIWVEARGESLEGQQAIAEVVYNRMIDEHFSSTLRDVIYCDDQFPTEKFKDAEPNQSQYDALEDALTGPYVLPMDVLYYATTPLNKNVWGQIGGHYFCYWQ